MKGRMSFVEGGGNFEGWYSSTLAMHTPMSAFALQMLARFELGFRFGCEESALVFFNSSPGITVITPIC